MLLRHTSTMLLHRLSITFVTMGYTASKYGAFEYAWCTVFMVLAVRLENEILDQCVRRCARNRQSDA